MANSEEVNNFGISISIVKVLLRWIAILLTYPMGILVCLEILLRLCGYNPEPQNVKDLSFITPDSILGWRHVPGTYSINSLEDPTSIVTINLKPDTGRMTRPDSQYVAGDPMLLMGGSFMMGYGLNDDETAPWKIQSQLPGVDVRNLGVGAYGAYQTLLTLEEQLDELTDIQCVVYGSIQNHPYRDVAIGNWLEAIFGWHVPHVTLSEDHQLQRRGLIKRIEVPYAEELAVSYLTRRTLNHLWSLGRAGDAKEASRLLIKEMQNATAKKDIAFYVALLHYDPEEMADMISFLEKEGIAYIDCNVPLTTANTIRGDGHPKEEVHEEWANRITGRLQGDAANSPIHYSFGTPYRSIPNSLKR